MFFRTKPAGSYRYLQIVHSVREGKKVRQQVIATLGRLDLLEASGQLERLMRSGLRHCQSFAVIDAHAAGEIQPVAIRRIGPDLVFARLWKESGIQEVLGSVLKARQYEFDLERAIYLTVLHRLFASGSDRAAERWREDYLIPGTEKLELHHWYRAMAWLGSVCTISREQTSRRSESSCALALNKRTSFPRTAAANGLKASAGTSRMKNWMLRDARASVTADATASGDFTMMRSSEKSVRSTRASPCASPTPTCAPA